MGFEPHRSAGSSASSGRELDCFRGVLDATIRLADDGSAPSLDELSKLLDYRRMQVEAISLRESERIGSKSPNEGDDEDLRFRREVSAIARRICALDDELLAALNQEKQRIIKEMGVITGRREAIRRSPTQTEPRLIDIYQG